MTIQVKADVAVANWITRIVADERRRAAVRLQEEETIARKSNLVRVQGGLLLDELCSTVARDVEAFLDAFGGERTRDIVFEHTQPEGGFVVRKLAAPTVTLTVVPRLEAAELDCRYQFTQNNGLPPREERVALIFDERETLQMKHRGTGQLFATADALSEFLLVPVLTGRPR